MLYRFESCMYRSVKGFDLLPFSFPFTEAAGLLFPFLPAAILARSAVAELLAYIQMVEGSIPSVPIYWNVAQW